MNKKIILSLGTTVLLASSLLAFSSQSNMKQGNGSSCKQQKMMKQHKQSKGHGLVKMFKKLDLSAEQRTQMRTIIKDNMKNMPNPRTAFSNNSFDKKLFVKLTKERRDNKIENRAKIIEKVYNILNSSQKKDLKTMLDMKEIMKKNQMMRNSRS